MLIGEVSRRTGISARMLRHYDRIGLVSPSGRTRGGYREYSEEDLLRLFHAEGLRSLGLSLQEIAAALGDPSFNPAALVQRLITQARDRMAQEQELLHRLSQVQASQPTAWSDVIRAIAVMRGLAEGDPSARQHLVLSLTHESDAHAAILVDAVLSESEPNVAGALLWALARIGDSAVPALQEALSSPSARRRHRAVEALVKIGSPRAISALTEAFPHSDPLVSGRAALARGTRGEADVIPALVDLVVEGRDDVEAADVLALLATHHGYADDITDAMTAALTTAGDRSRQRLAEALGGIAGPRSRQALAGLAGDSDRGVAATATFLLQQRDAPDDQAKV